MGVSPGAWLAQYLAPGKPLPHVSHSSVEWGESYFSGVWELLRDVYAKFLVSSRHVVGL